MLNKNRHKELVGIGGWPPISTWVRNMTRELAAKIIDEKKQNLKRMMNKITFTRKKNIFKIFLINQELWKQL
jgi:hypothetical protein